MTRIKVNLLQNQVLVEKSKKGFYFGGITKLDEKKYSELQNEKWIEYNRKMVGGQNTFLDARDDAMYISGETELKIAYEEMEYVSLSMCSRRQARYYNRYQIDLDITTKNQIYQFEIFNPRHFDLVIQQFTNHHIECIDLIDVIGLYQQYPDYDKLLKYLDTHFNQMAKKFSLDHPRTSDMKENYFKNLNLLKDIYGGNRK